VFGVVPRTKSKVNADEVLDRLDDVELDGVTGPLEGADVVLVELLA
jgi:hypothetical protein